MAADNNQDVLIERFCGVTGAEKERAIFYLQAAAWNLEVDLFIVGTYINKLKWVVVAITS